MKQLLAILLGGMLLLLVGCTRIDSPETTYEHFYHSSMFMDVA